MSHQAYLEQPYDEHSDRTEAFVSFCEMRGYGPTIYDDEIENEFETWMDEGPDPDLARERDYERSRGIGNIDY